MRYPPHDENGKPNSMHRVHMRRFRHWCGYYVWASSMERAIEIVRKHYPGAAEVKPFDHTTDRAQLLADLKRQCRGRSR